MPHRCRRQEKDGFDSLTRTVLQLYKIKSDKSGRPMIAGKREPSLGSKLAARKGWAFLRKEYLHMNTMKHFLTGTEKVGRGLVMFSQLYRDRESWAAGNG
jgi:hypothetical protein